MHSNKNAMTATAEMLFVADHFWASANKIMYVSKCFGCGAVVIDNIQGFYLTISIKCQ